MSYPALRGSHVDVLHQFAVDFGLFLATGGVADDVRLRRQVEHGREQSFLALIFYDQFNSVIIMQIKLICVS